MPKLTKEKNNLYLTEDGTKIWGNPNNAYFYVPRPELSAWIEAKHDLDTNQDRWDQFTPGEHFSPGGNRPALTFHTERAIRHAVRGAARREKYAYINEIGEDGETPFEGDIRFEMSGAHADTYHESASGRVWLAPGTVGRKSDTLFLSLNLTEEHVTSIYRELIARPQAILTLRLNFAFFGYDRSSTSIALERDAQVPILEASVSVMDRPLDWVDDEDTNGVSQQTPSPASVVVQRDFTPLVTRLNWAIGFLALLVLVALLK